MNRILFLIFLIFATPAFAILPSTDVYEIRQTATAGNVNGCFFDPAPGTGVDYSQQNTAQVNVTDLAASAHTAGPHACGGGTCDAGQYCVTSATGSPFTANMVNNGIKIATSGNYTSPGWRIIKKFVDANSICLDADPTNGSNGSAGNANVGGACSLNSTLDDDLFETATATNAVGGNTFYVKYSTSIYALGESVSIAASGGSQAPIWIVGYNTNRTLTNTDLKPIINAGGNTLLLGTNWNARNISVQASSSNGTQCGSNGAVYDSKFLNNSTTAARAAFVGCGDGWFVNNEAISYRGNAFSTNAQSFTLYGNYLHSSNIGFNDSGSTALNTLSNNIISDNVSQGINISGTKTARTIFDSNTLYGWETPLGTGLLMVSGATDITLINNIIAGFITGTSLPTIANAMVGYDNYNDYFNNGTDVSGWTKGVNDVALNPQFTSIAQVTNRGAVTAGAADNLITDPGHNFLTMGVTPGRDYFYLISGTNCTAGIYGIDAVTATTLRLDLDPTSAGTGSAIVYRIITGRNWAVGPNMTNRAWPGLFPASGTTGYRDIGAVQQQGTTGFFIQ